MKCRVIAAGTRLPDWINAGFHDYQRRLKKPISIELVEIPVAARSSSSSARQAMDKEGRAMLAALAKDDHVVALEVAGRPVSTQELAAWLETRMQEGGDVAFLIGGPDGLAPGCRKRAAAAWSLSRLTFPHALARVILAEQLYRAASLIAGHPYHRA
jgi:23S rRNA (pseudouridine1915-N3)-methyltransferase